MSHPLFTQAVDFFRDRNFLEAIRCLDQILEDNPEDSEAFFMKWLSCYQIGRYNETLEINDKLLDGDYSNQRVLGRVQLLFRMARVSEALESVNKYLSFHPDDRSALEWQCTLLFCCDDFAQVPPCCDRLLQFDSPFPARAARLRAEKGHAFFCLWDFEQALASYEQALADDAYEGKHPCLLYICSLALSALWRDTEAAEARSKAQQKAGSPLEAQHALADAYTCVKKFPQALAIYDEMIVQYPDDLLVWTRRWSVLAFLRRFEESVACYKQALLIDPENIEAQEKINKITHLYL